MKNRIIDRFLDILYDHPESRTILFYAVLLACVAMTRSPVMVFPLAFLLIIVRGLGFFEGMVQAMDQEKVEKEEWQTVETVFYEPEKAHRR